MATNDEIRRQNLALLIAEYGTAASLAAILERTPAQISQWLNQSKDSKTGKPRGMRPDSARYIEKRTGKNRGWMDEPHPTHDETGEGIVVLPSFDLKAAAGPGRYLEAQQRIGSMQVCQDIVKRILRNSSTVLASLALVTVAGDSMEPTIRDGDIVVIDRSARIIDRDGVYLFTFGDETFIKRIQRMPKALSVISDNELYKPWEIKPTEAMQLHVHGRVLWGWLGKEL
ncbi:putative phage repressor [Thiomonas sp. CB3]|jgi:SOS-response transcriptional repressor LexA|nr:putative phage repressor [Thiomonas sp. CB3]